MLAILDLELFQGKYILFNKWRPETITKKGRYRKAKRVGKLKIKNMKTIDLSKTILRISIAISIVLCSLGIFIFSLNYNSAKAESVNPIQNGNYEVVGVINDSQYRLCVIGYDKTTGSVKILVRQPW